MRYVVYRQKGGSVQWDCASFSGLDARPIYLQVHPAYYAAKREAVEKLWNAVRRARKR